MPGINKSGGCETDFKHAFKVQKVTFLPFFASTLSLVLIPKIFKKCRFFSILVPDANKKNIGFCLEM
jgi:hypothetical protein